MNEPLPEPVMEPVPPKPEPTNLGVEHMVIPECCREGWDSCPHVPRRQKKAKKNIAL